MSYSANKCAAVTPNDAVDDPKGVFRGIHCNASGNATVLFDGDDTSQTLTLVAGLLYPYRIRRVFATGLTATILGVK
jgi:hypothetical protein